MYVYTQMVNPVLLQDFSLYWIGTLVMSSRFTSLSKQAYFYIEIAKLADNTWQEGFHSFEVGLVLCTSCQKY